MTNTPNTSRSELTDREMQVLRLLAAGKTDKEIGRDLGISSNTVRRHVTAIYEKLQVSGRAQAVQRLSDASRYCITTRCYYP
ncbi:MAG: response regulator transcription factor [Anaerolineales bacterium]|nr:response regulator transcription factor [Anaerolineales bacterium]